VQFGTATASTPLPAGSAALRYKTGCRSRPLEQPMTDRETPRRTAADFAPEVLKLFDKYVHGHIDRRRLPRRRREVRGRRGHRSRPCSRR
jgi:hypothetical protein